MALIPEVKIAWLQALRSGEYKQGKHSLGTVKNKKEKHCCLGVLADICNVPKAETSSHLLRYDFSLYHDFIPKQALSIPHGFQDACGLAFDEADTLTKMNDSGSSFDEIADYIEENL